MTLTGELVFDTAFPSPFMMILSIHFVMSSTITFDWFSVHSYRNIQKFQQYKYQHNKKCLGWNSNRVLREFILCAVGAFILCAVGAFILCAVGAFILCAVWAFILCAVGAFILCAVGVFILCAVGAFWYWSIFYFFYLFILYLCILPFAIIKELR